MPSIYFLDYPTSLLAFIFIHGLKLIPLIYRYYFKRHRENVHRVSRSVSALMFIAFWIFLSLGWTGLIPFLYNFGLFRIMGIILGVSFLFMAITYDWKQNLQGSSPGTS